MKNMNLKTKIIIGAVVLVILSFWAGTAYANHKKSGAMGAQSGMTGGRGNYAGGMGGAGGYGGGQGMGGRTGGTNAGGFVGGTVLSKTDTTITVQNQDGGSKIILVSPETAVSKSASGSISDVAVGSSILATGTTNSDGSITAKTLQLRPAGQAPAAAPAKQ
jgi:hypothetical protein